MQRLWDMSFPPTIFHLIYHSKHLVCYCKETNCWEFPPKQHPANVPIAVCQVVGIWPHKWPHHISAQPQPRRAQERLPGRETSKHFRYGFWQCRHWAFEISTHFQSGTSWEWTCQPLPRIFIYPLPCPFQKQQSTRCWKQACSFLLPEQAAGHYGYPGGRCGYVAIARWPGLPTLL